MAYQHQEAAHLTNHSIVREDKSHQVAQDCLGHLYQDHHPKKHVNHEAQDCITTSAKTIRSRLYDWSRERLIVSGVLSIFSVLAGLEFLNVYAQIAWQRHQLEWEGYTNCNCRLHVCGPRCRVILRTYAFPLRSQKDNKVLTYSVEMILSIFWHACWWCRLRPNGRAKSKYTIPLKLHNELPAVP